MRTQLANRLAHPGIKLRRLNGPGWVAAIMLTTVVLFALLGPVLIPYAPNMQTVAPSKAPSAEHIFGLDAQGRDILARLAAGARWSLGIGLGATAIALVVGSVLGAIAGTSRRLVDELLMRVLDVVMAFPGIALAAVLVAVFGRSLVVLIAAIGFLYTPQVTRIVRANVKAQYGEDYVSAERILGARNPYIVVKHIAVNVAAPVLVFCTVLVADAIVFEASLSFIGAGVQQPNASWGSVIALGKDQLMLGEWWATTFPGLLIFLTVVALNVLSESFSDTLAAPSARTAPPSEDEQRAAAAPLDAHAEVVKLPGLQTVAARLRDQAKPTPAQPPILSVEELSMSFPGRHGGVNVLDGVSLDVRPGEVLGLIGESGGGKSLTSLAIIGLEPRGAQLGGRIMFDGRDLLSLRPGQRRELMGSDIAMIYQDALSSLNPAMTVQSQLNQFCRRGGTRTPEELLELVNLDPGRTLRAYPHELSGGQRQRVLIAMALSRDPRLVIADEPTTALDVTVQAQVMQLLLELQAKLGFAMILVSHDLALVSSIADRVVVLYGGRVAESGALADVVAEPQHHYTRGLLSAVLSLEASETHLTQIAGVVPSPADFPSGCRFADRCRQATDICLRQRPEVEALSPGHEFACHHPAGAMSEEVSA